MADGLDISITGLGELDHAMQDMGEGQAAEGICRRALRAGGDVMKGAIAANAPVRPALPSGTALPPGTLQSDITVTVTRESPESFSAWIEPGKYSRHVASWVEWGHRLVKGKKGKVVGDVVAHPYIRPAFDANEELAAAAMAESITADVTTALKGEN